MTDLLKRLQSAEGAENLSKIAHNDQIMLYERAGVRHVAVGNEVHPGITLLWTLCEKHDVPANSAFISASERPSCPHCLALLKALETGGEDG